MKRCYYEILEVERKATESAIKSVRLYLFRHTEKLQWSVTLTKTQPSRARSCSWKFKKLTMFFLIPTKERFMTTIERRFSSIKTQCQRRTLSSTVLVSIFGNSSQWDASKDWVMKREVSFLSIELSFNWLKVNKGKPLHYVMIWRKRWENTKVLEH